MINLETEQAMKDYIRYAKKEIKSSELRIKKLEKEIMVFTNKLELIKETK